MTLSIIFGMRPDVQGPARLAEAGKVG
jgi:hypothetical protein